MFELKFRGVRGSRPTPIVENLTYGGNTSCIEIFIENKLFIFDAGTGIIDLGNDIIDKKNIKDINIFITHSHWDHIQGIPFFKPIYKKHYNINFFGEAKYGMDFETILKKQMSPPFFPTSLETALANINYYNIDEKNTVDFNLDGDIIKDFKFYADLKNENFKCVRISTCRLNHPNSAIGYKIEYNSKCIVYATDCEHLMGKIREDFVIFARNADILIYDSQYTEEEYYSEKKGWGHSTWLESTRIAKEANVKKLYLFHHAENRTDIDLENLLFKARIYFKNTYLSKENEVIKLI